MHGFSSANHPSARGSCRAADWATQPELSKVLRGKFTEVSLERLMHFLTALGYHIEIGAGKGEQGRGYEPTAV